MPNDCRISCKCGRLEAMASLRCVSKVWFTNEEIKGRLMEKGLKGLIMTEKPGQAVAAKNDWHAVNKSVIAPVIEAMREAHRLKTPSMNELESELSTLGVFIQDQPVNCETLEATKLRWGVEIHVAAASIKKILSYLRRKFLLPHVPRDRDPVFKPYL